MQRCFLNWIEWNVDKICEGIAIRQIRGNRSGQVPGRVGVVATPERWELRSCDAGPRPGFRDIGNSVVTSHRNPVEFLLERKFVNP